MAKSLRTTAVSARLRKATSSKNCYPCQWAKLLPMSAAAQGSGPERFHVSGKWSRAQGVLATGSIGWVRRSPRARRLFSVFFGNSLGWRSLRAVVPGVAEEIR